MPSLRDPSQRGSLFVQMAVEMPDTLTPEQKEVRDRTAPSPLCV